MSQRVKLEKRTIRKLIFQNYGLSVLSLKEKSGIYKAVTDRGTYAFKNAREIPDLAYIRDCLAHIRRNGFTRLPEILPTLSNHVSIRHLDEDYYMEQWIEGWVFSKGPAHLEPLGAALADFHRAARGIVPPLDSLSYGWGKRPEMLLQCYSRLEEWDRGRRTSNGGGYEREMLQFLKYRCRKALVYLKNVSYSGLLAKAPESAVLCHGSLHRRNIVVDGNNDLRFIDMESMIYAERVLDLAQLLHYHAPPHDWNPAVIRRLLQSYESRHGRPIGSDEWKCLLSYLAFPRRLFNCAQAYFARPEPPRKNGLKLQKVIELDWPKERFFNEFEPLLF